MSFSLEEISKHNNAQSLWIVINNEVYDVTKFVNVHPGGKQVLLQVGGQDCTKQFYALHQEQILLKYRQKLKIGVVKDSEPVVLQDRNQLMKTPYGEQNAFCKGMHSPYYNETHLNFKLAVRKFVNEKIRPFSDEWEENGKIPSQELYREMGKYGLLAAQIYPGDHLKYVDTLPGGVDRFQFDYFHELLVHQEMSLIGAPAVIDSLKAGLVIGLPPVLKFAQPQVKEKVARECLNGEKRICLAITDPDAGSDVANLTCVAKKSECGKFYIVNGTKKWITNGMFCDYFVTAVRTGDSGIFGVSMLLIERSEGLVTKPIKTSYSSAAGTAYITFDNVKVPVENLLGEEDLGFQIIMSNFNHERWVISTGVIFGIKAILEQCFRWVNQRETFGKKLIEQPVIRNKLANMTAQVESLQSWLENLTFQMIKMDEKKQFKYLGGQLALLKLQTTRTACYVADQACQIFGGRAITRTGMGMYIERFQKTFKFYSIYGGSEEIMADLGIKQAIRAFPKQAKL